MRTNIGYLDVTCHTHGSIFPFVQLIFMFQLNGAFFTDVV